MNSTWRQRRKNTFILIILILVLAYSGYKIYPYLNPVPTCFDKKQNGDELGVDCGGSCQAVCPTQVAAFNIKFAKAIKTEDGLYDLVALVENKNSDKNTVDGSVDYIFNIYDKAGSVIKTVTGTTSLLLGQTFPVIVQNTPIDLGSSGNDIGQVSFQIKDNNKSWKNENSVYASSFFNVYDTRFDQNKNDISQLNVTLQNLTAATFRNFPVRVMLYDDKNNLIGVNETIVKEFGPREMKNVIFTWRNPLNSDNPKVNVYEIITPFTVIK
ncbi:MAG: hypothetical protein U0469_00260 [Candidatus Paceibacterota bacterium]|jgi:hypothetical protein